MYAKMIESETGIYSIDKFVFDFETSILFDLYKMTLDNMVLEYRQFMPVRSFSAKRFAEEKLVYQFDRCHIELWQVPLKRNIGLKLKPVVVKDEMVTRVRLEFNPNKCMGNEPLKRILGHFSRQNAFSWSIVRVDYAFDVIGVIDSFYCLTRKTESNLSGTRYYGVRGQSGFLRVYDKRKEILQDTKHDIGYELTRFEWEQRGNVDLDFTFDKLCTLNFEGVPSAKILRFVSPELINQAVSTYARNTAWKIRKQCFNPLPFDPYNFRVLLRDYLEEYGLPFLRRRNFSEDWAAGEKFSMN